MNHSRKRPTRRGGYYLFNPMLRWCESSGLVRTGLQSAPQLTALTTVDSEDPVQSELNLSEPRPLSRAVTVLFVNSFPDDLSFDM